MDSAAVGVCVCVCVFVTSLVQGRDGEGLAGLGGGIRVQEGDDGQEKYVSGRISRTWWLVSTLMSVYLLGGVHRGRR